MDKQAQMDMELKKVIYTNRFTVHDFFFAITFTILYGIGLRRTTAKDGWNISKTEIGRYSDRNP